MEDGNDETRFIEDGCKRLAENLAQKAPMFQATFDKKGRLMPEVYGNLHPKMNAVEMKLSVAAKASAQRRTENEMTIEAKEFVVEAKAYQAKKTEIRAKRKTGDDDDGVEAEDSDDDGQDEKRDLKKLRYSDGVGLFTVDVKAANEFYQPRGDFAQTGSDSFGVTQDNALIQQIAPFLGAPTRPVPKRDALSHPMESHELPDAFIGDREYNRDIIFNGLLESDKWYLGEDGLQLKHRDSLADFVWDQVIFDNHILGRVPYLGVPSLVTNRKETRRAGVVKFGIGQELEGHFYRTKEGQMIWSMGQEQFVNATEETFCLGVITELLTCRPPATNENERDSMPVSREAFERDKLFPQCEQWDNMRKGTQGLRNSADQGKRLLEMQQNSAPSENLVFILPKGAAALQAYDRDRNDFSKTGVSKPNYDEITMNPKVYGVGSSHESRSFRIGRGKPDYDPMFQHVAIGSFFTAEPDNALADSLVYSEQARFQTNQEDVFVYRAGLDDAFRHTFKSMFAANQMYKDHRLTNVGKVIVSRVRKPDNTLHGIYESDDQDSDHRRTIIKDITDRAFGTGAGLETMSVFDWYAACDRTRQVVLSLEVRNAETSSSPADNTFEMSLKALLHHSADAATRAAPLEFKNKQSILAFLRHIKLDTDEWFQFAIKNNIPTFLPHRIFVPNQIWLAGTAILMVKGSGFTYVGFPRYSIARNGKTDQYVAAFSIHGRSIVTNPQGVCRIRNCYVKDYVYGDNGIFYTSPDDVKHVKNHGFRFDEKNSTKTAFVVALPPGFKTSSIVCDMTGKYPKEVCADLGNHYPTAEAYATHWGWEKYRSRDANGFASDTYSFGGRKNGNMANTVCFQGYQAKFVPEQIGGKFSNIVPDRGHKGLSWGPGGRVMMKQQGIRMLSSADIRAANPKV